MSDDNQKGRQQRPDLRRDHEPLHVVILTGRFLEAYMQWKPRWRVHLQVCGHPTQLIFDCLRPHHDRQCAAPNEALAVFVRDQNTSTTGSYLVDTARKRTPTDKQLIRV